MRILKVWVVILAMLAVSAPSFGYVLVYNVLNRIKAVDSAAETLVGTAVRGYLLLDINDANGDVNDSYWLIYGKDTSKAKVYTWSGLDPDLSVSGRYESIYLETGDGWTSTVVGKITNKDIGLAAGKRAVAYTMSGNFVIVGGVVLDATQYLTGSGAMVLSLNSTKTKTINLASTSIDDAFDDLITVVEGLGYDPG
jgi:hypothetical protein